MAGRATERRYWLAAVGLSLLAVGLALSWPRAGVELDCAPGEVRRDAAGVAFCPGGAARRSDAPVAAGQALTLGRKLDLNAASVEELRLLPGIGAGLAQAIVAERERLGRYSSWTEVDAVTGVGPAKLTTLQAHTEIE